VLRRGDCQFFAMDDDTLIVRRTLPGYPAYEYTLKRI